MIGGRTTVFGGDFPDLPAKMDKPKDRARFFRGTRGSDSTSTLNTRIKQFTIQALAIEPIIVGSAKDAPRAIIVLKLKGQDRWEADSFDVWEFSVPFLTSIANSDDQNEANKQLATELLKMLGKTKSSAGGPPVPERQPKEAVNYRTWTSRDGRKLDAALVRVDGETITIRRRSDGKTFSVPLNQFSDADRTWAAGPGGWPTFSGSLEGPNEVRVKNPNAFEVRVGLRSSGKGHDFFVPANGLANATVPDGKYEIYFVYSSDPTGIYQGDNFSLASNGVEIQIVKVVDGNYGIRKIK